MIKSNSQRANVAKQVVLIPDPLILMGNKDNKMYRSLVSDNNLMEIGKKKIDSI